MAGTLMYEDLAAWWPLISPVEEYADEAVFAARVLRSAAIPVREVLELGSGGGHLAAHLSAVFRLTLTDLAEPMLEVSRQLNPECEHVRGDMRELRLGRQFDAVLAHDAIDYMTTDADLRLAVGTAFAHCRPGGIAVFVPDHLAETFEPGTDHGGTDAPSGRGVRYLEWTWDPDPGDTTVRTEYAFVLRESDGTVRACHETHVTGIFGRDQWLSALADAGFEPEAITEETTDERAPRVFFAGHRPA